MLGPGDALVLYTDGVIEASPLDDALGPERLAEFLAGCCIGRRTRRAVAEAIEEKALAVQDGQAARRRRRARDARRRRTAAAPFVPLTGRG